MSHSNQFPASKTPIDIVLGAGGFGTKEVGGIPSFSDKVVIQSILDEFKKHGHNLIDTARIYGGGTSESLLAELDYHGQGFVVDTKINSFFPGAHNAENIHKSLEESLAALKTNKVRVLFLHCPDRTIPLEGTVAAIDAEYKKGHFEKFGLSNFSAQEVSEIIKIAEEKGYVKPTVYQGMYNVVSRRNEEELFPLLRKHGISFHAYSPLGGSFLTAGFSKDHQTSRFDRSTLIGALYANQYIKDSLLSALEKLHEIANHHGLTVQEIALRWLVHHSVLKREFNDAIITGGTKLVNIQTSLEYVERPPLPAPVVKLVEEVWQLVKDEAPQYHM